jgi:hypothetical protein
VGQLTLSHSIAWESTREDRATTDHSGDRSCRAAPFARVFKSEISKDIFSWFDELRAKTSEAGPRENPVLWIELRIGSARFGAQKRDNDNLKIDSLRICRNGLWPGVATCTLNSFI